MSGRGDTDMAAAAARRCRKELDNTVDSFERIFHLMKHEKAELQYRAEIAEYHLELSLQKLSEYQQTNVSAVVMQHQMNCG